MKENSPDDWEARTLAYLSGHMDETEREAFEAKLAESEVGRAALTRSRAVLDAAQGANDKAVERLAHAMLDTALAEQATDLHFEVDQRNVVVRTRIGGALREQTRLPKSVHQGLVDWWKQKINADLSERRKPQTGRMVLSRNKQEFGLRVAVLPQFWGESIHVRLTNRSQVRLGLDALGLRPEQAELLRGMAATPNGLILTGGPRHSGKTTLLYSLLQEIQGGDGASPRHILTIEDPVELTLAGIGQTAINPAAGLSRASALRAFLEADPDVIYCSELREAETARLAVEAALNGNLILSAVPGARSAWEILERLRYMGIENFEIAATLLGLIGQRLVRTFAPNVPTEPDTPHSRDLAALGLSPAEDGLFLRAAAGVENHGFSSVRTALFEIVPTTATLVQAIVGDATTAELWAASCGKSGTGLRDEAALLVRMGRTTAEEAARATADYPHAIVSNPAAPLTHDADFEEDRYILSSLLLNE